MEAEALGAAEVAEASLKAHPPMVAVALPEAEAALPRFQEEATLCQVVLLETKSMAAP